MTTSRNVLRLSIGLCLLALLAFVATMQALPQVGGEVSYFTDASKTVQCGTKLWNCGPPQTYGTVTNYWILEDAWSCATPPQPCCWYDGFSRSIVCGQCS